MAMHFAIFLTYDTLIIKTEALCLVSDEGRVKYLLLLYFVTRATPIDDINSKSHKTELKSRYNYSTNRIKSKSRH